MLMLSTLGSRNGGVMSKILNEEIKELKAQLVRVAVRITAWNYYRCFYCYSEAKIEDNIVHTIHCRIRRHIAELKEK